MSADDHGSASTYTNHKCRCDACRKAQAAACAAGRQRRMAALVEDPTIVGHGLATTYTNYACRCEDCTDANRRYKRDLRARRRAVAS